MDNRFVCIDKGEKIDIGIIEKVERKMECRFPNSYKQYVSDNNGAYIEGTYTDKSGIKEIIEFTLLMFEDEILEHCDILEDCTPKDVIPFATDAGGNYYCFDYKEDSDNPKIVLVDHETTLTQEDFENLELEDMTLEEAQREDTITDILDSFDIIIDNLV